MFYQNLKSISSNFINFIFPIDSTDKKELEKIIKNNIIFDENSFSIFLLPYKNRYVKKSILNLKFHNNKKIGKVFGSFLLDNISEDLIELSQFHNFSNPLWINIPLSKKRLRKRTYNQNDIIMKSFIKSGGDQFVTWERNNLLKIKNTKPQSHLKSKAERLKNPLGTFELKYPSRIKNKNIILFDDIYTTGATANEAKKVLKKAGAKKVLIIAMAR